MKRRWLLVAVFLAGFTVSGCQFLFGDDDPDQGGLIYNATDESVFIYVEMAGGDEIRLGGVQSGTTGSVPDPCQDRPLVARNSDDGPVVDSWDAGFCRGDYWSIPHGGFVENNSGRSIVVRGFEPGTDSSYSIKIEAGRTGSLRAPCADPPITAGGDLFEAPPREERLCFGEVWVIEEP